MKIGPLDVGPDSPCRIVAEMSGNHLQVYANALRLIRAAKRAGADAIKFQCFTMEEILGLRGDGPAPVPWERFTKRELYERNQTPLAWFPGLFAYARKLGLPAFSTVLGAQSLAVLESLDCPAYKLAKAESDNAVLYDLVHATGKPVIVSVETEPYRFQYPLYCPPGYPATGICLPFAYQNGWLGFSLHNVAPELPIAAVARGAQLLEYHLMLPQTTPLDVAFSHTPPSFARLVKAVRAAEAFL